ncbi:hypothetical protein FEM03_16455 [Phragmitibacter flavus]|uniref:Uncharacterized protein n=1 Tax=Phragmitibacter flavus TaxID=2576071 RepID=A0A5R8KB68_9BACT|nr:hypothetical protein [Phragmitibacter flavus]TLD69550.1 hypothetical protein FEM03_16455 [Phragmitibacter flavus]
MDTAPPLPRPTDVDDDHLKILVILHFIMAGLGFVGTLFIIGHYFLMTTIMKFAEDHPTPDSTPMPPEIQQLMVIFYLIIGIGLLAAALLNLFSAIFMRKRRHRMFSLITAGLNCVQFPIGTALGIFTIIVLCRNSVRQKFDTPTV